MKLPVSSVYVKNRETKIIFITVLMVVITLPIIFIMSATNMVFAVSNIPSLVKLFFGNLVIGLVIFILYQIFKQDFFAPPVLFSFMWLEAILMTTLKLSELEQTKTNLFWVVVFCGWTFFLLGAFSVWIGRNKPSVNLVKLHVNASKTWAPLRVATVLTVLLIISITGFLYEYKQTGVIPLLSTDAEFSRFTSSVVNGYVHTIAMSSTVVVMVGITFLLTSAHLKRRWMLRLFVAGLIVVGILVLTTRGSRGQVLYPLVTGALVYHYTRHRLNPIVLLTVGVGGFIILAYWSYFRKLAYFGPSYIDSLMSVGFPEKSIPFASGYLTVTINFEILNMYLQAIPSRVGFQWGHFIAFPFLSLFPGQQMDLTHFQNILFGWSRVSENTSTYISSLYIDFGMWGVSGGSFIIGLVSMLIYTRMLKHPTPFTVLLHSYNSFNIALLVYTYSYGRFVPFWDIGLVWVIAILVSKRTFPKGVVWPPKKT